MYDFQLSNKEKKKAKLKYRVCRAKKDEYLLEHQHNLSKITKNISPSSSLELNELYNDIKKSYDENDIIELTQKMTKLCLYAYENFVDIDSNFNDLAIENIIFDCLQKNGQYKLQKATISFLTNSFQNNHTDIMNFFVDNGIIETLYDMLINDDTLVISILQCVSNIAAESKDNRNKVFKEFNKGNSQYLYEILDKYNDENIFIAMSNLICSYCQYPGDEEFNLYDIFVIIKEIFIKIEIINAPYISPNNFNHNDKKKIFNFIDRIKSFIPFINTDEIDHNNEFPHNNDENRIINFIHPLKAFISFINTKEACGICINRFLEDLQSETPKDSNFLYFIISFLDDKDDDTIIMCLIFLNKLFENINCTLEKKVKDNDIILNQFTSQNGNMIWYEKSLSLFNHDNEKVVWHAIRFISNCLVLNPELCDQFFLNKNQIKINGFISGVKIKKDEENKSLLDNILGKCENGSKNVRLESIFLLSNLIRLSTRILLDQLCSNEKIIDILVSSLNIDLPELINTTICTLAKILQSEISESNKEKTQNYFDNCGGNDAIEDLISNKNKDISQQAMAFKNLVLTKPKPFEFDDTNI